MKTVPLAMVSMLLLTSCVTWRSQEILVDGKRFDLSPRLYREADPELKRLSQFIYRADCVVCSSCIHGMSVRIGHGDWKHGLSADQVRDLLKEIPEKNLAVVELSEWVQIENLVAQNAEVVDIVTAQPFREIIIVTPDSKDMRVDQYINNSEHRRAR